MDVIILFILLLICFIALALIERSINKNIQKPRDRGFPYSRKKRKKPS
ncbi:MAG: hypothetical protein LBU88_00230 [Treponema sp.]|nr:hypothetical protein [Treponema sp.]